MALHFATLGQQTVFRQAIKQGLVKDWQEAYEVGAAALRRQLESSAGSVSSDAEAFARNQLSLF